MLGVALVLLACCMLVVGLLVMNTNNTGWMPPLKIPQGAAAPTAGPASPGAKPGVNRMLNAGPVPAAPSGFTTVFTDSFGGPAGAPPSEQNWFYDIGTNWGNHEVEHTTSSTSNTYVDGHGDLVIKANEVNGKWTSGRIESTRDDFFAPRGGKMEMTASIQQPDVPNGLGYWPAFWALGSTYRTGGQWPTVGELDMMEDVNGMAKASQTIHDAGSNISHKFIPCPDTATTCQTGFHTYSVIVDRTHPGAEFTQYLMDGKVELTITEAEVGTQAWQAVIDHGFFIILNLAMGGAYPDWQCQCTTPTSGTTSGGAMKVAYVAVYEQGTNSTPTAAAKATGRLAGYQNACLSNQNSLNASNNGIVLKGCDGSDGQQWTPYSDGTLRVQGGCLDVANGTKPGGLVQWFPCNGLQSQVWQPRSNGELYNPYSGLCLTGADQDPYAEIEPCTGSAGQKWAVP